jgi:hypothetical protein
MLEPGESYTSLFKVSSSLKGDQNDIGNGLGS